MDLKDEKYKKLLRMMSRLEAKTQRQERRIKQIQQEREGEAWEYKRQHGVFP